MPKTVTLIRCRSGFANVPDSFVVYEPGDEGAIDEYNEELGCYELPEGFTVAETVSGEHEIFKRGQNDTLRLRDCHASEYRTPAVGHV